MAKAASWSGYFIREPIVGPITSNPLAVRFSPELLWGE